MKLPQQSGTPLIGMVSRMADQKGFDLVMVMMCQSQCQKLQTQI